LNEYITRINAKALSPEDFQKLLETLEYCRTHDKHGTFNYTVHNRIIKISSPNKIQSFKRGMYFKKKFGVYFNVICEADQRKT